MIQSRKVSLGLRSWRMDITHGQTSLDNVGEDFMGCGYLSATAGAQKDLDYHLAQIFYITRKQQQNRRL